MKDRVIFRKWPDGDVIALLIDVPASICPYLCMSYQHIGQHGAADPHHVIISTIPATPSDCVDLMQEMGCIGYNLKPVKRTPRESLDIRRRELAKQTTTRVASL